MQTSGLRIGVFGGAFDPPHLAHRALAEAALAQLVLDELWVLPTGQAWHKPRPLTDSAQRVAMARLAFSDLPPVHIDDRETRRSGPSYTWDTLTELHRERPGHTWFLIMGEDQAKAFPTWHRWREITDLAQLVVARRDTGEGAPQGPFRSEWQNAIGQPVMTLQLPFMDISATRIRHTLATGGDASAWLARSVQDHIFQHQLYRTEHE